MKSNIDGFYSEKDIITERAAELLIEELIFSIFILECGENNISPGKEYWDGLCTHILSHPLDKVKTGIMSFFEAINREEFSVICEFNSRLMIRLLANETFMSAVENNYLATVSYINQMKSIGSKKIYDITGDEALLGFKILLFIYCHNDTIARAISENSSAINEYIKSKNKTARWREMTK